MVVVRDSKKILLEKLLGLVNIVENPEKYIEFKNNLEEINDIYTNITCKDELFYLLDNLCLDIPNEYLNLLEILYLSTLDNDILKKQIEVLTEGINKEQIDVFYGIFLKWQLGSKIFLSFESDPLYEENRKLHKELIYGIKKYLELDDKTIKRNQTYKKRILVLTTQFLGEKHGPTRNVLDYCYILRKYLNKDVFLLVASEMPSHNNIYFNKIPYSIAQSYRCFNHIDEINGDFEITYRGEMIKGFQCPVIKENKNQIKQIIEEIYEWSPGLVYNMGGDNVVADICGFFTNVVTLPFSYRFPISESKFLILPRKIESDDKKNVDFIKENKQKIIESVFVYKLGEAQKKYLPSDFQIEEEKFVIAIVGTRLDQEIDDRFIKILKEILKKDSEIYLIFIGKFDNYNIAKEKLSFTYRTQYIGFQEDLRGILNIADLYLNPPRKGGGTSAVEAMAEGLPVITLPKCDVAYAAGSNFICEDLSEISELILKYKKNKLFYQEQSRKAIEQVSSVVNTKQTIEEIINYIEKGE